jgi:hypothetical protein
VIETYSGFELLIEIFTCIETDIISLTGREILHVYRGSKDERRAESESGECDKNVELHNDRKRTSKDQPKTK